MNRRTEPSAHTWMCGFDGDVAGPVYTTHIERVRFPETELLIKRLIVGKLQDPTP